MSGGWQGELDGKVGVLGVHGNVVRWVERFMGLVGEVDG